MPRLQAPLALALLASGCAHATPAQSPSRSNVSAPSERESPECVAPELSAALVECHVPALSARSTEAADEAFRVAQEVWDAQDWDACAIAFERVLELRPSTALAAEASYAALLCTNNALEPPDEQPPSSSRARSPGEAGWQPPTELPPPLSVFAAQLSRGACLITHPIERAAIEYRRARLYYDHGRAAEAAVLMRRVALGADPDYAILAAEPWLDSLEELARRSEPVGGQCADDLRAAAERLGARWCETDRDSRVAAFCATVERLLAQTPSADARP